MIWKEGWYRKKKKKKKNQGEQLSPQKNVEDKRQKKRGGVLQYADSFALAAASNKAWSVCGESPYGALSGTRVIFFYLFRSFLSFLPFCSFFFQKKLLLVGFCFFPCGVVDKDWGRNWKGGGFGFTREEKRGEVGEGWGERGSAGFGERGALRWFSSLYVLN